MFDLREKLNFFNFGKKQFLGYYPTVASIKIDWLQTWGIQGIILDLDNTIISEDDRYLSPRAEAWITEAKSQGLIFFMLSNGKRSYRVKFWSHWLNIPAINPAQKPFPKNFRRAMTEMQLLPQQVIVIGDGWHTDILGAKLVGCYSIQVASLPHPPRWWEKFLGKWWQKPYPQDSELWELDSTGPNYPH